MRAPTQAIRRKPVSAQVELVLAAGVGVLSILLTLVLPVVPRLEHHLLDWELRALATRNPPDPAIVFLDIDEPTLEAMARQYGRYPWSRAVYGTLLERLAVQRPAAVVFDILFTDPHLDHEADDLYFIETAQGLDNVYFPMVRLPANPELEREQGYPLARVPGAVRTAAADADARAALLLPLPGLSVTGRLGTINIKADPVDGLVRRYPLFTEAQGWRLPSLPVRVAQDLGYPIPAGDTLALAWHGPSGSYASVSFYELFADLERQHRQRPPDEFTGKILLIGTTSPGLHDLRLTPMGANFPGTEVLATALDNLKNGRRVHLLSFWAALPLTGALLLALALAFRGGVGLMPGGVGLLLLSAALVAGSWLSTVYAWRPLPVVSPVLFGWLYYLTAAVRAYLRERGERRRVTQIFGRFLDPRVVADLVNQGETTTTLTGQKREVTVLFSDIRGFTTLSEKEPPQVIVDLLNRYFARQVDVIYRHQGTLDKYIGDGIMAFWGAPTDQPEHARQAVAAAREMVQALEEFRRELGQAGAAFDIGIGIHTGEAVVGFIGSPEHRQDYTVVGDTVNTASRIEGKTRGRCRVLVSAATRRACGEAIAFRDRGRAKLKGRTQEVRLYEPLWS